VPTMPRLSQHAWRTSIILAIRVRGPDSGDGRFSSSAPTALSNCASMSMSPRGPAGTEVSGSRADLPYYRELSRDIFERVENAIPQAHCYRSASFR
jgi:hypothetical protein